MVLVHSPEPVADADWTAWVEMLHRESPKAVLVVSPTGRGPDAKQRRQVAEYIETSKATRTAVLSDSVAARVIVTGMSWFNSGIRAFRMNDIELAYVYLELAPDVVADLGPLIRSLNEQVGAEAL